MGTAVDCEGVSRFLGEKCRVVGIVLRIDMARGPSPARGSDTFWDAIDAGITAGLDEFSEFLRDVVVPG